MKTRVGYFRWGIALLLGFGIVINYLDRVNITVGATPLIQEFHISKVELGVIFSSYLWSYTLLQIPIGTLLDRIGIKWLMRVGTFLWSVATLLTAVVSGLGLIILARILLGVAEAPAFPGASKATGYWFPIKERGLATSSFDAAAKFSNVIGIPVTAAIVSVGGWRAGFYYTAAISLIYAFIFWFFYRDPKESKVSKEEYDYIVEGGAQPEVSTVGNSGRSLLYLLGQRKVWAMTLGFAAYGYSFYLYLTWLPGYLETALHMSVLKSGIYSIAPWAVATLTDIFIGGWLVDRLIARGFDQTKVRKSFITAGLLMGVFAIGAAFTTDPNIAIIWISIALGGLAFFAPVGWSLPAIIAPKGTVGTTGSIMNCANNLAGIIAPIAAGYIFDTTHSFSLNFIIASVILILGILCYLLLIGKIEQIPSPFEEVLPIDDTTEQTKTA